MAVSPFAAPMASENPAQQAAAMAIERREAGPEAQMAEGQSPVAVHLVAAMKALIQRGAAAGQPLPEDMAAIQQFMDALMQMQQGGAPQGQGAPVAGPPQGMAPAGLPQG